MTEELFLRMQSTYNQLVNARQEAGIIASNEEKGVCKLVMINEYEDISERIISFCFSNDEIELMLSACQEFRENNVEHLKKVFAEYEGVE